MNAHAGIIQDVERSGPSPREMTTSLIICCYQCERWGDLCAAIDSALAQQPALEEIVVVVDHNDALKALVSAAYPDLLVIENTEERGLSGARNSGIAAAKGELIAFLDDDAVAAPDMIRHLRRRVERDQVLGAVAEIQPEWLGSRAAWFPDEFLWVVGCTYKGMHAGRVRNLLGAAMCIRRAVFETVGGFHSGLGRNHSALPFGCEETEFCIRANRAYPAFHFAYDASAWCRHKVPPRRVTWKYFLRRCYAEGWSKAHVALIAQGSGSLSSERVYVTRTVPLATLRGLSDFILKADLGGLGRAVAGTSGLIVAAAGYLAAGLSLAMDSGRASALRESKTSLTCNL
jgi:glucosyl-dolichyl phosphate glucuronosyltransferase